MVSIYITPKHADMIYSGRKKSIVMKRHKKEFLSNDLILVTKKGDIGYALGKIKLSRPKIINSAMFLKSESQHLLTQQEKKEKFPGAKKFYFYDIKSFMKFDNPKPIQLKPNTQSLQNISSNGDFAKDLISYNPIGLTKKVLQDDWRIVSGWFSARKNGRKTKATKEQIFSVASQIYFELKRKGVLVKKQNYSKDLISKININFQESSPEYKKKIYSDFLRLANQSKNEDKLILFRPFFQGKGN